LLLLWAGAGASLLCFVPTGGIFAVPAPVGRLQMKKKRKRPADLSVKVSISLKPEEARFLFENKAVLGGNTSRAVALAIQTLMDRVAEHPAAYTVSPVLPTGVKAAEKNPKL
jgi:hypothetical protein